MEIIRREGRKVIMAWVFFLHKQDINVKSGHLIRKPPLEDDL